MKKIIAMFLATVLLCSSLVVPAFAAEKDDSIKKQATGITRQKISFIEAESVDTTAFFTGASDNRNGNKRTRGLTYENVVLSYDSESLILSIEANIIEGQINTSIAGSGITYNREHVNYSVCYLVDISLEQSPYTIVYMELFKENNNDYLRMFTERNSTGEMYSSVVEIQDGLVDEIHLSAFESKMSEEQYMNLVTLNSKSPNHSFEKDTNSFEFQDPYQNVAELDEDETATMPRTNMLNAWISLLSAQKNNSSLDYSEYDVDQAFFDSVTATAGQAQWRTYTSSPSYDYRVVRCAYYQAFSGTYTFYYALIRPRGTYSGDSINFYYGFVDFPNTVHPSSYSYRVELNKNTKTMRYVADYGLKFKPTLHLSIDSGSFISVTTTAQLQNVQNASNLAMFAVGMIPKGIGTGISILDLILQYGDIVPETTPNSATRKWDKQTGDPDRRDVVLSFADTSLSVYKPKDQLIITTEKTGSPTAYYSWAYSVSV